jgi:hypothetical protein
MLRYDDALMAEPSPRSASPPFLLASPDVHQPPHQRNDWYRSIGRRSRPHEAASYDDVVKSGYF